MKLILTCEHAGNEIPPDFKKLFSGGEGILETHRGFDLGALDLFQDLKILADFSQKNSVSRLLIEVNRSLGHKQIFSEFTSHLSKNEQAHLIESYYLSYRNSVENEIQRYIELGQEVLHLSIHSFTPVLNNTLRSADIGILYDPKRKREREVAENLKARLNKIAPDLLVKKNYPYKGIADGFTTYLRQKFFKNYMGLELEINQKFAVQNQMDEKIKKVVFDAANDLRK